MIPVAGEVLELRATSSATDGALCIELESDEGISRLPATVITVNSPPDVAEGHLGLAAAGLGTGSRQAWRCSTIAPAGRFRYRFCSERCRTRWYQSKSASWQESGGALEVEGPSGRLEVSSLSWLMTSAGPVRVRFALRLQPEEHVVGFGERFDALDQRGRSLDATVFEQYKGQGSRTYLPMPFAIVAGGPGWGFHLRTSRRTFYDVGVRDADLLWVTADLDPVGTDNGLSLQIFEGSPRRVLSQFLDEAGRPELPPAWIFEPWMSGNEWNSQERVMAEVARGRALGIPAGVVVIEAWSDESTFVAFRDSQYPIHADGSPHRLADFEFPEVGAWPDPKGMVDELHRLGLRVLLWQIPLMKSPPDLPQARADWERAERSNFVVAAGRGSYRNRGWWFPKSLLIDFSNPEAKEWWLSKRRWLVDELGIDGFKTDGGEHAWGEDLTYADGRRGVGGNNRYPVLYQAAYHELMRSVGKPPVTFSRAGFTGAQAYPCHWAGDEDSTWEAFRASITAGLSAAACGIFFWGWDLGGFSGEVPDAELYLRAAAMACFCPIMQYHSEYNGHRSPSRDRTPWNIAERTGDPRVIPAYRSLAEVRMKLVPYLESAAARAVAESVPIMRPLFFEEPQSGEVWHWPLQYYLGSDLLVAPVTEPGVEETEIYVPSGRWIEPASGMTVEGPGRLGLKTPIGTIPLLLRAGPAEQLAASVGPVAASGLPDGN